MVLQTHMQTHPKVPCERICTSRVTIKKKEKILTLERASSHPLWKTPSLLHRNPTPSPRPKNSSPSSPNAEDRSRETPQSKQAVVRGRKNPCRKRRPPPSRPTPRRKCRQTRSRARKEPASINFNQKNPPKPTPPMGPQPKSKTRGYLTPREKP